MCVRIVFVLVLCCDQSWAQQDSTLSSGFQDRADNPGVYPPPPLDQSPVLTDFSEHPDILPQPYPRPIIVQSPGFPINPQPPEGRPPLFGQPSNFPGMQEHKIPSPLEPEDLDNAGDLKSDTVQHAGVPSNLSVFALPLEKSDHELQLNVSWLPPAGAPATGYTVEVMSVTDTSDCDSQMCYQTGINENVTSVLIPPTWTTVPGGCAIHPGCAYLVKLKPDPWDGFTTANLTVELGECEAGVCSCAHSPRLPKPVVSAKTVTINNTFYSNVSWYLPTPSKPQRLPAKLGKRSYVITLYKQIPTQPKKMPYFIILQNRTVHVDIGGLVFGGDTPRSIPLPISLEMTLNLKIIAQVQLVDARGCIGPAGIATVFDPASKQPSTSKLSFGVYAILGALIGAWAMGAVFVLSARVVKRVLKYFRPAPVSAPLEPLRRRPAWFPLQLRT